VVLLFCSEDTDTQPP